MSENAKCWLIAHVSPSIDSVEDTFSTLKFCAVIRSHHKLKLRDIQDIDLVDELMKLKVKELM